MTDGPGRDSPDDAWARSAMRPLRETQAPYDLADAIRARVRAEPDRRRRTAAGLSRIAAVLAAVAVVSGLALMFATRPSVPAGSPSPSDIAVAPSLGASRSDDLVLRCGRVEAFKCVRTVWEFRDAHPSVFQAAGIVSVEHLCPPRAICDPTIFLVMVQAAAPPGADVEAFSVTEQVGDPQIADWTDPIPAYIAEITSGEPPSGGLGAAEIDVQGSVDPEDEVIDLLVTEVECASGRDAEGRVRVVQETYSASRVEVLIGVERMGGRCPSNPPTPVKIRLIEPVGDRELSVISVSGETAGLPPTPSPSPSPTAPPAQVAAGPATVAQQMPLRTDPYVVASVVKHVQRGQIVYVLEGSVTVQERTWRLVQFSGDSDDGYGAGAWSGWVEEPELQRSVRPATPVCPEAPTLADLVSLSAGARLWCYGDRPLTLTPVIAGHSRQGASSDLWLSGDVGIVQPEPFDSVPYHIADGSEVNVRLDRWQTVTGHFDDPAAMGCVRAATEPDLAFLECRERFVVTSAIPADPPDSEAPGTWRRIADAPIPGRNRTAGVWTGSEMIVWGGGSPPDGLADGAAYDPQRDRWRVLAESPLRARVWHAFAWTGELLFIWGGEANSRDALADGALYDPRRDEWRSMAPAPIGGGRAKAVWTGELVVVVTHAGQAAMYDADTDRWERLPDLPSGPGGLQLIWTGARVMALDFGEWTGAVEISLLDPAAGAWEALGPSELDAGGIEEGIWTGNELIVLAGDDPIRIGPSGPGTLLTGRFDPTTGTWEEIPLTCDINTSGAVWTGRLVVTESGTFDPADGTCRMLPRAPVREVSGGPHRESWTPVWTGTEMIFWSGYAYSAAEGARVPADGSAFRPEVP